MATAGAAGAAARLAAAAARIFGSVLGAGAERSGRKLLSKPLVGDRVAAYYGQSVASNDPLFEDPLDKRCAPRRGVI